MQNNNTRPRIKIKKCSVSQYWYKTRIGEVFELTNDKKYEVKRGNNKSGYCYIVLHENQEHVVAVNDCEILK